MSIDIYGDDDPITIRGGSGFLNEGHSYGEIVGAVERLVPRAYCVEACAKRAGARGVYRLGRRKIGIRKHVRKSSTVCPDCGYALFWTTAGAKSEEKEASREPSSADAPPKG